MQLADRLLDAIETASTQSSLPDEPNSATAIQILVNMRSALYV